MSETALGRVVELKDAISRPGAGIAAPCAACPVRELSVCAALEPQELNSLAAILTNVELAPGDPLIDEGEPAEHVFNITQGTLKVYKLLPDGRRQITGFLFPGDFLGLVQSDVYVCSAEAVTETSLCRFTRRKLDAVVAEYPKLESRLLNMARTELAEVQDQILLLGRKTAKERLATFLLTLARRAEARGDEVNPVAVPMSRDDIGDFLGLTTETVSRTFTQLKANGIIRLLEGGKVQILDTAVVRVQAALDALIEGDRP